MNVVQRFLVQIIDTGQGLLPLIVYLVCARLLPLYGAWHTNALLIYSSSLYPRFREAFLSIGDSLLIKDHLLELGILLRFICLTVAVLVLLLQIESIFKCKSVLFGLKFLRHLHLIRVLLGHLHNSLERVGVE